MRWLLAPSAVALAAASAPTPVTPHSSDLSDLNDQLPTTGTHFTKGNLAAAKAIPDPIGWIDPWKQPLRASRSITTAHQIADCMAASHLKDIYDYLGYHPNEGDRPPAWLGGFNRDLSRCFGAYIYDLGSAQIQFGQRLLAGLLAEAFLRRFPVGSLPTVDARTRYEETWITGDPGQRAVAEMSACVADRQPERLMRLFETKPGSADEAGALRDLEPFAGPCLANYATVRMNSMNLRAALAEALYHRAVEGAASVASSSKKAN